MAPISCTNVNQVNRQKLAGNIVTKNTGSLTLAINICDGFRLTASISKRGFMGAVNQSGT